MLSFNFDEFFNFDAEKEDEGLGINLGAGTEILGLTFGLSSS